LPPVDLLLGGRVKKFASCQLLVGVEGDRTKDRPLLHVWLKHVFQPRYMSFELCVRLEPVSKLFSVNADLFYHQLQRVDVKHFLAREPNVNWARKIYRRCPNLKHVQNMLINDDDSSKRSIISTELVSKMKSITSLTLDMKNCSPLSMLMLVDMRNLDTVKITSDDDNNLASFNDMEPIEKLRVKSLDCDQLFWTKFFDPDNLEVLKSYNYRSPDCNQLIDMLVKFENLRELHITLYDQHLGMDTLDFVDFAYNELGVGNLFLELACDVNNSEFRELSDHVNIQRSVNELNMFRVTHQKMQIVKPCIAKLSRLTHLHIASLRCTLDASAWQKLLPSLKVISVALSCSFKSPRYDARLSIFTDYYKR